MDTLRPLITLKCATSLDGRIALADGSSQWITGEKSRQQVHRLRATSDGVATGIGSVLVDNPRLTARLAPRPSAQPLRIIFDSHARLPPDSSLVQSLDEGAVLVIATHDAPAQAIAQLEALGVEIAILPSDGGQVDLRAAMSFLWKDKEMEEILIECGGRLASSLLRRDLVDYIEWFRAPILLGADGLPCFGELDLRDLSQAPRFQRSSIAECGPDLWESYERVTDPA